MTERRHRSPPATEWTCPICGTALHTGQGLYACPSREWVGIVDGSTRGELSLSAVEAANPPDRADERTVTAGNGGL